MKLVHFVIVIRKPRKCIFVSFAIMCVQKVHKIRSLKT